MSDVKTEDAAKPAKSPEPEPNDPGLDPVSGAAVLGHSYDGIQEYDNPLPGWWKAIFWLTILFLPLYIVHYHAGAGLLVSEQYEVEAAEQARIFAENALKSGATEEGLAALARDPKAMEGAEAIYTAKCAVCHGPQGQGLIGPNLTDDHFIHGATLMNAWKVINEGVPEKGMVAWGKQLKPAEVMNMAAYVSTLRGTNPPNPKAPEGTKVE